MADAPSPDSQSSPSLWRTARANMAERSRVAQAKVGLRLNAPPGWPPAPSGWQPPEGWQPDPSWPAAPADWVWWLYPPINLGRAKIPAGPGWRSHEGSVFFDGFGLWSGQLHKPERAVQLVRWNDVVQLEVAGREGQVIRSASRGKMREPFHVLSAQTRSREVTRIAAEAYLTVQTPAGRLVLSFPQGSPAAYASAPGGHIAAIEYRQTQMARPVTVTGMPHHNAPDVVEQLRRLAELRDAGVVTADEFEAKKAELLSRM